MLTDNNLFIEAFINAVNAKNWCEVHAVLEEWYRCRHTTGSELGGQSSQQLMQFLRTELMLSQAS